MRWRSTVLGTLGLAVAATAGAQDVSPELAIVGTWVLGKRTEGCTELGVGEVWTFDADGRFRRVQTERKLEETGRWALRHDGRQIELRLRDKPESHVIMQIDGRELHILTPTQVEQGVVIAQERFTSFYHS